MVYYENFEVDIDDISNIISLCPNCHRKIHHGKRNEVEKMVNNLWNQQKETMADRGIIVTLEELLRMY